MSFTHRPWLAIGSTRVEPQPDFAELGLDARAIHGHRDARGALPQSPILRSALWF
jgi:hypothetical protein